MAATKSAVSIMAAITTTQNSSQIDCSTDYAQEVYASITQVGTANTSAAQFLIAWSPDGSTFYNGPIYTAGVNAATYYWTLAVPVTAVKVMINFTAQNGGTSSTITAQLGQIVGI